MLPVSSSHSRSISVVRNPHHRQPGISSSVKGILSCVEVINNELPEHESEAFKQTAFDLAAAIAEHATPVDNEKDFKFIKNLRVRMSMM